MIELTGGAKQMVQDVADELGERIDDPYLMGCLMGFVVAHSRRLGVSPQTIREMVENVIDVNLSGTEDQRVDSD